MNPIIQFAGGLILGVLIAMGYILRMQNNSTTSSSTTNTHPVTIQTTIPSVITASEISLILIIGFLV